jgi:hypothetical protein
MLCHEPDNPRVAEGIVGRTLLQSCAEPLFIQLDLVVSNYSASLERMLNRDVAAVLLPQQRSNDGTAQLSQGVSCDVIGDSEKY